MFTNRVATAVTSLLVLVAGAAWAQAPTGATAQCKDGTYYGGASRQGACAGHGGVKAWLGDKGAAPGKPEPKGEAKGHDDAKGKAKGGDAAKSAPPEKAPSAPAAKEAPKGAAAATPAIPATPATPAKPAQPTAQPAARPSAAPAPAAPAPAPTAKPAAVPAVPATPAAPAKPASPPARAVGGGEQVWVNKDSKIYHCQGDRWYGTTKNGEYMSRAAADAAGMTAAKGKYCAQ